MNDNLGRYQFDDELTRGEKIFLWIYLPIHVVVLPLLLGMTQLSGLMGMSEGDMNLMYYGVGLLCMLIFLRSFLRRSFDRLCDRIMACAFAVILGYMLMLALNYFAAMLETLFEQQLDNLNNDAVTQLASSDYGKAAALAVFLAPMVEEPLFRAGIFGTIRKKHRFWAYAVSIVLFALYHVWQYALAYADPMYLLIAVEYIPAGLALCWAYDRTGSIWTPIFLHMLINWLNLAALSATQ
jgi:membrane protease YdiL (CAAX protease family)